MATKTTAHESPLPQVTVVAGVVVENQRVLVAQRPPGAHLAGTWEFPGGKVRCGETPIVALRRELDEEIGVEVGDVRELLRVEHPYPDRVVALTWFLCDDVRGEPTSREGQPLRWVTVGELTALDVPPANVAVLRVLAGLLGDECDGPLAARDGHAERELKLGFAGEEDFRRALAAPGLGEVRGTLVLRSHYFDTVDLRLARRRVMLRLRESGGEWTCGLKLGAESEPGFFASTEVEERIDPSVARDVLDGVMALSDVDSPAAREVGRLFGRLSLVRVGGVTVERTAKAARGEVLEFDRLEFSDGARAWELEVETEDLDRLSGWIYDELRACGSRVEPQRLTKLERVLARGPAETKDPD